MTVMIITACNLIYLKDLGIQTSLKQIGEVPEHSTNSEAVHAFTQLALILR